MYKKLLEDDDGNKKHDSNPDRSQQYLANERTFLAWLRTCIALIGLGFIVARFGLFLRQFGLTIKGFPTEVSMHYPSSLLGISIVVIGIVLIIYALKNYLDAHKSIERGMYVSKHFTIYAATISLVIFSVIIIVYLFILLDS